MLSKRLIEHLLKFCGDNLCRVNRRHRHFSFICQRSNIIAVGFAQKHKTHTRAARWFGYNSIHSEFDALRQMMKSNKSMAGMYMVNIRIRSNGQLALSRPCVCCTRMLIEMGVRDVYYSCPDGVFRKWRI